MKRILQTMTIAAGVALLGSAAAAQQSDDPGSPPTETQSPTDRPQATGASASEESLSRSGRKFAEDVLAANAAEVKLGSLAQEKASSSDVKDFAQQMVDDHQKATDDLKDVDLVQRQNISEPQDLKPEHQRVYDQLSQLSGDQFDREYIKHMVKDHEKTVKKFRKQSQRTSDRELSEWAQSTLPKLEEHLADAKRIQQELESSPVGTSGTKETTAPRSPGMDDDTSGTSGTYDPGDDIDEPGHTEPPPPAPTPDPTERP